MIGGWQRNRTSLTRFELVAQYEALTDKLTIRIKKVCYLHRRHTSYKHKIKHDKTN